MKINKKLGNRSFVIAYNMLGFVGISAYIYGQKAIFSTQSLNLTERDFASSFVIAFTALFFFSSFLLIVRHKGGIVIPIFLLTFIITAGFIILAPLLLGHMAFYSTPQMQKYFTSSA